MQNYKIGQTGYPEKCNICVKEGTKAELFKGGLELSVRPFWKGNNPKVMLVGLNPTLANKQVRTVFDLDNKDSQIFKYISHDILEPTRIKLNEHIYATNLVKCTFPYKQEPRVICEKSSGKKDNQTVKKFLSPFFQNCKKYFKEEINQINPKVVIFFGEVPHQLIVEEFDLQSQKVDKDMKKAFSNIYRVNILDRELLYVPCIRLKVKRRAYFRDLWDVFIKRLQEAIIYAGISIKEEYP
jgi:Uracil DNA glycosylase superfamily.